MNQSFQKLFLTGVFGWFTSSIALLAAEMPPNATKPVG
jgi:hypothetical protein